MRRKRLWLLTIMSVAALAFTGCGKGSDEQPSSVEEIEFNNIADNGNTAATEETEQVQESSEAATDEETRDGMYRSELTNEWIDESLKNQRPIAVMVDNEKTALPHYGLTDADVVYEIMNSTANGRITRLMAIVKDWGKITQLGSVRSTRPTNILLAAEWNAVLCHDGGPFYIDAYLSKNYAAHFSGTFSRVNNGKSREFTEYICEGDLDKNFSNSNYTTEYNEFYPGTHYVFSNDEIDLSDAEGVIDAKEIKLPFAHNGSTLKYNESTGTYDYYEYGKAHVDPGNGNAQLSFKNLLIQDCTFTQLDDNGYLIYNCIDSGRTAYYVTNGKAVKVTWIKASDTEPTIYLDNNTGEQIKMNTGKTYVTLVPSDSWDDLEIN